MKALEATGTELLVDRDAMQTIYSLLPKKCGSTFLFWLNLDKMALLWYNKIVKRRANETIGEILTPLATLEFRMT